MRRAKCVRVFGSTTAAQNLQGTLAVCRATFIWEIGHPATTGGSDAITQPPSRSDTHDSLCALRPCPLLCQSVRGRTNNYCHAPSSSDLPHHPPHADPLLPPARARRLSSQSPRVQANKCSRMLTGVPRVYRGMSCRRLMAEFGHIAFERPLFGWAW